MTNCHRLTQNGIVESAGDRSTRDRRTRRPAFEIERIFIDFPRHQSSGHSTTHELRLYFVAALQLTQLLSIVRERVR